MEQNACCDAEKCSSILKHVVGGPFKARKNRCDDNRKQSISSEYAPIPRKYCGQKRDHRQQRKLEQTQIFHEVMADPFPAEDPRRQQMRDERAAGDNIGKREKSRRRASTAPEPEP